MAQLRIPWLHTLEYFSLLGTESLGLFGFNTLIGTPLPAGLSAPTWKLFCHLEDLELISAIPNVYSSITVQSGRVVGAQAREVDEAAHPYSAVVSSASSTMKLLGRAIPLLSGLMATPIWFLDRAAATIRSFGFSRPTISDPIVRHLPGPTALEHNVDVASPAFMVGPLASNTLATDGQLGGNSVDEMSLSYVLSQWSQCATGTISTARVYTWASYRTPLSPTVFWFRDKIGATSTGNLLPPIFQATTYNCFQPTTLMAIASCFRMWRGSIEFRITFGKTKFHAGRVLLSFSPHFQKLAPGTSVSVYQPTNGTILSPTGLCMTFDLKDSNVVTFVCPFTSPKSFLDFEESFGDFTISIVDPIQAPPSVATSIDFMVEVRAGKDFDLAVPLTNRWPVSTTFNTVYSQSGRVIDTGNSGALSETITSSCTKYTVGESIASLKQLIQLPKFSNLGGTAANATSRVAIMPWFYRYDFTNTVPALTAFPRETFGLPAYIAGLYAFVNGSTETHAYTFGNSGAIMEATNTSNSYIVPHTNTNYTNSASCSNPSPYTIGATALHFKMPAYQSFTRLISNVINGILWNPRIGSGATSPDMTTTLGPSSFPELTISNPLGAGAVNTIMQRQAGDDARCAHYIGPMPFAFLSVNVAGPWDPDSQIGNL
jgi:hypothetical protein